MAEDLAEVDTEQTALTSRSAHLSAADIRTVLELHDGGYTQVEIAQVVGCAQATVSRTLKTFSDDAKQVARRLRALTDDAVDDWRTATTVAAKRGDHRPAKELIEMAHPELSVASHRSNGAGGGGVTVIVAVPGSAQNPLPTINITKVDGLSPSLTTDLHKLSD